MDHFYCARPVLWFGLAGSVGAHHVCYLCCSPFCKVCQVAGTLRIKITSSSISLTQCHSSPKFSANLITPSSAPPPPSSSTMVPPISVLGIFPNPNFASKLKLYFCACVGVVDFNVKVCYFW